MELRTKCLSRERIIQFWYKKRKTYHTFNMLQTFLQIGYLCKTHRIFSTSLCEKGQFISTHQCSSHPLPTKAITDVTLWGWSQFLWIRIPAFFISFLPFFFSFLFFGVFFSDKFCFSLHVFFFLIDKPFFTWIPQLIACVFCSFFFFFVWCYVVVSSLNFSSFLHCNYNTSLFDLFF